LSRTQRIVRFVLRAVLGLCLLLVGLLAAAYAFTFTDRFRELARTQALALLASSFRGQVSVARLEGSVWGDLRLGDVTLRYGGVDVVQVPEVVLRYSLLPLLRQRLEISAIELSAPVVDLRADENGAWNLTTALTAPNPAPPASGGSFPISIANLALSDGKVSVTPCRGSSTCLLDGIALDAKVGIESTGIDADVRKLALRAAVEGVPLVWLDSSLRYSAAPPSRAEIRSVVLSTESSKITLKGTVDRPDDIKAIQTDAALTIDSLAPQDLALVAPQATLDQPITGSVRAKGPANDLRAEVDLAAGEAHIRGNARADLAAPTPAGEGTLELKQVDLGKLAAGLGVGGVANGNVQASARGTDVAAAHVDAHLELRGAVYQQWRLGDLATNARLADGRGALDGGLQGPSGKVTWKGQAELAGEQRFDADVTVDHFDPKRLIAGATPGDLNVRAVVEGRGFALDRQQSHTVVTVARSRVDRVVLDRGRADLRIAGGRLRIGELSLDAQNATLRASGDVGLAANARGEAKLAAKVGDVAPWLALVGTEGRGSMTLDGNVRGSLGDLATDGTLSASALGVGQNWVERSTVRFDLRGIGAGGPSGRVDAFVGGVHSAVSLDTLNLQVALSSPPKTARTGAAQELVADCVLRAQDLVGRNHQSKLRVAYDATGIGVELTELHLEAPQGRFDLAHPARISWRKSVLAIDDLRLVGEGHSFAASGSVSQSGPQRLEVTADHVPLEWVKSFNPQAPEMSGMVAARMSLAGTAAAPDVRTTLTVTDLKVPAFFIGPDANPVRGRAAIRAMYAARAAAKKRIAAASIQSEGRIAAGPDDVYEWGSGWIFVQSADGTRSKLGGRFLTVWHRQADGTWVIIRNLAF